MFLEADYEDRNGDPGNLFDEGWDAEIYDLDIDVPLDWDDFE